VYHLIERTIAKALRTYIRTYFLFKSDHVSAYIKITLCNALISSVMIYASPTWECAADALLLKPQRVQNKVLCAIGNLYRRTPVREICVAFKIPYVYGDVTKLCSTPVEQW
jgi:hypothetical protein